MATRLKAPEGSLGVLVIDDNAQNAELLCAYLADLGCVVRSAPDGQRGLDEIATRPPDLVLLDIMMPQMSGYDVCQRLKSDPETQHIQVVMVTALNDLGDLERAADCGADDFLTKPVNRIELLLRATSLLRLAVLERQAAGA